VSQIPAVPALRVRRRGKLFLAAGILALLVLAIALVLLAPAEEPAQGIVRRPLATVGEQLSAQAFSPDGRKLVTGDRRGVRSWDVSTWRELGFVTTTFAVNSIVFSPDGVNLAILGDAQTSILNMKSGKMLGAD
jgi:WD40 repeat protein